MHVGLVPSQTSQSCISQKKSRGAFLSAPPFDGLSYFSTEKKISTLTTSL